MAAACPLRRQCHYRSLQLQADHRSSGTQRLDQQRQRIRRANTGHGRVPRELMMFSMILLFCIQILTENVKADPVLASSLGGCKDVPVRQGPPLHCCLPAPTRDPVRFTFPVTPAAVGRPPFIRERKPAHVVQNDTEYVRKYNLAYARMKALPDTDPRSFFNQWRIHCSFCNNAFHQRKPPGPLGIETPALLQVHYSWIFLPWHRMYLYYHERILRDLIDDPTFSLPFWNWDNQLDPVAPMMPSMYLSNDSDLFDARRNPNHIPSKFLHLGYDSALEGKQNLTDDQIRYENLCVMYNSVVTKISGRDFLGGPYVTAASSNSSAGESETPSEPGGLETVHNRAHDWTGLLNDPAHPDNDDMGSFIFAARDPIFYAHHSNIDRLWDVWKTLADTVTKAGSRRRGDFASRDFLDSEFTFYDEKGDMVIVEVRDTLDSEKLGYKYTNVTEADDLWIKYEPLPPRMTSNKVNPSDWPAVDPAGNNSIGNVPVSYKLDRGVPSKQDLDITGLKDVRELQENILLENVRILDSSYARLDVFINYPQATRETLLYISEYVGTFTHLPNGVPVVDVNNSVSNSSSGKYGVYNIRYSIGPSLRRLGIEDYDSDITVTIVSKGLRGESHANDLYFSDIKQDFQ